MFDKLCAHIITYLAQHQVCVLSTTGTHGAWAMPVSYHHDGLQVTCLLPVWADVAYHLEQDPRVMLLIYDSMQSQQWMQTIGTANKVDTPDWERWPDQPIPPTPELYQVDQITPERIELFDERQGWGRRETLDL